jgi:hypothetical protein
MGSSLEVKVLWRSRWYERPAGANCVTARWGRKEARGKGPTRGDDQDTRLGDVGEPARCLLLRPPAASRDWPCGAPLETRNIPRRRNTCLQRSGRCRTTPGSMGTMPKIQRRGRKTPWLDTTARRRADDRVGVLSARFESGPHGSSVQTEVGTSGRGRVDRVRTSAANSVLPNWFRHRRLRLRLRLRRRPERPVAADARPLSEAPSSGHRV